MGGRKGSFPFLSSIPVDCATAYVRNGIPLEADVRVGDQNPRATLRRGIHAAQGVLREWVGAEDLLSLINCEVDWVES